MAIYIVREAVFTPFLDSIYLECNTLCQKSTGAPTNLPLAWIVNFKLLVLVKEVEFTVPLLFSLVHHFRLQGPLGIT